MGGIQLGEDVGRPLEQCLCGTDRRLLLAADVGALVEPE
jgi:hypothetical protein